ncbi:hypothetical protein BH10CYA1_BH10CYA1_61350 [soil metagenome]
MLSHRKSKHAKLVGRLIPEQKGKWKLLAALSVSAAFFVLIASGAGAKNELLQESAVKAAADRFERQLHGYSTPQVSQSSMTEAHIADQTTQKSKVPMLAAPHGVDASNKFIAQTEGSSGGGAQYDPQRRIVKIVETSGGTVTSTKQFVWAGDQLAEERDASGNVTRRFYDLGEQVGGTNYFYTRDRNDSVREMTNSSGGVQSQFNYDPYGRPTQVAGTSVTPAFGYAGMYIHQPSGLNLAVDRAYDPSLGRWISRDPITDPTFALTPSGPGPADPGASMMASVFGQGSAIPANPDPSAMTSQMVSSVPIVQQQLARVMSASPQATSSGSSTMNPYAYVANNPISERDPSGLLMTPPPKPGPAVCPATGNDLYDQCVKNCKRDYAGMPALIARCIWLRCRQYL